MYEGEDEVELQCMSSGLAGERETGCAALTTAQRPAAVAAKWCPVVRAQRGLLLQTLQTLQTPPKLPKLLPRGGDMSTPSAHHRP